MGSKREGKSKPSPPVRAPRSRSPHLKFVLLAALPVMLAAALGAGAPLWPGDARFIAGLQIGLVVALAAVEFAVLAAWRRQSALSRPLSAITRAMTEGGDAGQIDLKAGGEIGDLIDGFNQMLGEIRARDQRLAAKVTSLEGEAAVHAADLGAARTAAEAAEAARSDLLAAIDHEIRTPVNGVVAMAQILAAGDLTPGQRRSAEVIAKSGASLLTAIADITDGPMAALAQAPVDLVELAEDVSALFWETASAKGLDLAVYVDPATPKLVNGDPAHLRQVIGALVSAAVRSTHTGGVLVEIEPDAPGSVRISVRDTGVGVAKDKIGGTFGASLGLAACKRLVEAMHGRFHVTSEVGKGSTFAFRIPITVIEPAAVWPAAAIAGAKAVIHHDGVSTRRALSRYLARAGYGLAVDGDAARPDVVFGSAGALPRERASLPTVCLGEYGDTLPHDLLRTAAAQALLIQPFRRGDLETLLRQMEVGEPLHVGDATSAKASAAPRFDGAHVLFADASAVNREAAMQALSRLGVRVSVAVDGRQALERARAERFDLIFIDDNEAAHEIRRVEVELGYDRAPIVALTAGEADAWREADMDAALHTPFSQAALVRTLAAFIEPGARITRPFPDQAAPAQAQPEARQSLATSPIPIPQPAFRPVAVASGIDARLIDPDVAASLAGMSADGRSDFVENIRTLYRDSAPASITELLSAAAGADADAATHAAQALKSMSLNIGAREVARRAAEIEAASRAGTAPDRNTILKLDQVLKDTLAALTGAAPAPVQAPAAAAAAPLQGMTRSIAARPPEVQSLLDDLAHAIEHDQLTLVYQPQFDRDGRQVLGVETLVRWTHPVRGFVSPADFIPIAEAWGGIRPLTDWVMNRAVMETADLDGLQVAFNTSALEFTDAGIVDRIKALLERTGFDPKRLEVEITETAILNNEDQVRENMNTLREMGLKVALDDFGAGYSSLGHLRRYPFDKLKIDREFVIDCTQDVQSATVVHAVVSIGRALGMKVVAEGVETEQQRQFLKIAGVHAMQGYLFGKPMPIAALREMMTPEAIRARG